MIEYLDEKYPNPPLLPNNIEERATVRQIAQLIACDIHPLNNTSVLARLRSQFGADDAAIASWYEHWIVRGFEVLEQMLPSCGGYCVGDRPTLADIVLVPQVANARRYPQIDLAPFPNIVRIDAALKKLKAFHDAAPEQQPEAKRQ
jgi:maleylacetoacetate isomerase